MRSESEIKLKIIKQAAKSVKCFKRNQLLMEISSSLKKVSSRPLLPRFFFNSRLKVSLHRVSLLISWGFTRDSQREKNFELQSLSSSDERVLDRGFVTLGFLRKTSGSKGLLRKGMTPERDFV